MKEIEENKLLTKEFKTVELEKLKKKRKLMDKLVYREIKKQNTEINYWKCAPKKKINIS